jgi:4-hydroxy-tetrahydrodipicolinate reductase
MISPLMDEACEEGRTMNIALIGYGKMGHEVERLALSRGDRIVGKWDPSLFSEGSTPGQVGQVDRKTLQETIQDAEVCIDFTQPRAVLENVRNIARLQKPLVVGTTGWYEHLTEVQSTVSQNGIGLVHAPNFSLGINLFYLVVEKAAELFNSFEDYDVFGSEIHHRHKVDSPSGTAKRLSEIVLKKFTRKKRAISESLNRAIAPDEFHLVSIRAGEFPGIHSLTFDSPADTIELTHMVRSRAGFATGALLAAEWILRRKGFYTFEQVLQDVLAIQDIRE